MFELPTQLSSIVLEIANVRAIILMKQDDDNTNRDISYDESQHPGVYTLASDIEEDDLDNLQEVLHSDQAHHDKTIWTTRVPLPNKWNCADTVIALTPHPNLQHPVGAIAPLLLKLRKSAINISRESDGVQALPLPKASGDQNVPQPKTGGDQNIPQHQKATFEVAKQFTEAIVFTKIRWHIIFNEKYWMVEKGWKQAIEAQDCRRALAGAPVGAPSVCQLSSGPSHKIDPQIREPVSLYSVFCSWTGHMTIPNLKQIHH